jgi:ribosome-associated protein
VGTMLQVSSRVSIPLREIQLQAIRSQGAGGQNVNKVSTAVHLFFDIRASSLPEVYKERLLKMKDRRISLAGTVIIKSQESRSQEANREKALERLRELILEVTQVRALRRRRLDDVRGWMIRRARSPRCYGCWRGLLFLRFVVHGIAGSPTEPTVF